MSIIPEPYVLIEGSEISPTIAGRAREVTLDTFQITYGRRSTFDQPSPARLTVSFLLRAGSSWLSRSISERGVQVWVRYRGGSRRLFLGRAREAEVTHVRDVEGQPVYRLDVTASDATADLERVQITFDRREEQPRARLDLLQNYAQWIISGIGGPAFWHQVAPKRTTASVLSEITAIYNSGGEGVDYDPHTNRIESLGRPDVQEGSLTLRRTSRGTYAPTHRGDASGIIRPTADKVEVIGPQRHDLDQVIPRIKVTGGDWNNGQWRQSEWVAGIPGGNGFGELVVRSEGFSQELNGNRSGGGLKLTWDYWKNLVDDARTPAHPPIRSRHTAFDTAQDMIELIGCREIRRAVFIDSCYLDGAYRLSRVISGTVKYAARPDGQPGQWTIERHFANVPTRPFTGSPLTGKTVNPTAGTVVRFRDLDETVTARTMGLTTKGV